MPERQDDNYQYDADTLNSDGFDRYRLYEKGDDGWLEIIDTKTNRAVHIRDGEIRSDRMNGIESAREEDGDDIFDAVNKALASAGSDTTVFVEPGKYTRANGRAVSTQLETTHEGQRINFLGADVEVADGADIDPVHIHHDSSSIHNLVIRANRANNTLDYAIHIHDQIDGGLENVEVANAPVGIWLHNCRNLRMVDIATNLNEADLDTIIRAEDTENSSIESSSLTGFSNYGVELVNSQDLRLDGVSITTDPDGQALANAGLRMAGTVQSRIVISVESFGDVDEGILVEPYDVGGADETVSSQNTYDVKVEGANSIGVHLSDSKSELVEGFVDGEGGDPETVQGFLVDAPNAIEDTPGHELFLNVQKCTRITDTQISSTNAGMLIDGHHQQITETSTIQNNGTGILMATFGPGLPQPIFNVLTNTTVEADVAAQRQATDANGQVTIDWSNFYAFDDKPALSVQLENPGSWYVDTYNTDANGRYISATIQVTDPDGTVAGSNENVLAVLRGT